MPSVLHNLVKSSGHKLSRLADALKDAASKRAVDAGMPAVEYKTRDHTITKKAGKKFSFGRSLVGYERLGPFQRQIAKRYLHGEAWPVMETYYIHKFLHATKGWRTYTGGPALRMPFAQPHEPYHLIGRNPRFANAR